MSAPLFPSLSPRTVDRTWFSVDKPLDDEAELSKLEEEYQNWHQNLLFRDSNIVPIGKSSEGPSRCVTLDVHQDEEEDEEDDDEGDEEEDSDTMMMSWTQI